MQSRERITRRETERNGLAVPIALLALVLIGVLVTGAFYMLSRDPDSADSSKVSVHQTAVPAPPAADVRPTDSLVADSVLADSLKRSGDAAATSPIPDHAPLSTNSARPLPARDRWVAGTNSVPASRRTGMAGTPDSGALHEY